VVKFDEGEFLKMKKTQKNTLNPADLNFIPNPQYLMDTMKMEENSKNQKIEKNSVENLDDLMTSTNSENSETPNKIRTIQTISREEDLIIKSGKFKFLKNEENSKNEKKCYKCEKLAEFLDFDKNRLYCARHCIQRAMEEYQNLSKEEIQKKEYLEKFMINIKKTKFNLEEVKSFLNQSRLVTQENNSVNLKRVNLLFKIIFEETKHLYSCFLDQIGKKIGESELIHHRTFEVINELEKDLLVIDKDIDRNYANIVLNMDIMPFQGIMGSYEEKIKENLAGIGKARDELSELKQIQIEFKKNKEEKILGKEVTNFLFELITSLVHENESIYEFKLSRSKELAIKGGKITEYLENSQKMTNGLKGDAQKVIQDLNLVIEKIEGLKKKQLRTPIKIGEKKKWSPASNISEKKKKNFRTSSKKRRARISPRVKISNSKISKNSKFGQESKRLSAVSRLDDFYKPSERLSNAGYSHHSKTPEIGTSKHWSKILKENNLSAKEKTERFSSKGDQYNLDKSRLYEYFKSREHQRNGIRVRRYESSQSRASSKSKSNSSKILKESSTRLKRRNNFSKGKIKNYSIGKNKNSPSAYSSRNNLEKNFLRSTAEKKSSLANTGGKKFSRQNLEKKFSRGKYDQNLNERKRRLLGNYGASGGKYYGLTRKLSYGSKLRNRDGAKENKSKNSKMFLKDFVKDIDTGGSKAMKRESIRRKDEDFEG